MEFVCLVICSQGYILSRCYEYNVDCGFGNYCSCFERFSNGFTQCLFCWRPGEDHVQYCISKHRTAFTYFRYMKYRDRTEIITDMLRSASKVNGACKTRIMHEAFLSLPQLKEYFPLLLRNGLLEYDEVTKTYKITGKGSHVLELSASLNHIIDPRITNRHKNTIKILI